MGAKGSTSWRKRPGFHHYLWRKVASILELWTFSAAIKTTAAIKVVSRMCEASNKRACARLWFGKRKHGPLRQSMRTAGTRIETVSEVLYVSNDGADSKRVKISGLSCEVLFFPKKESGEKTRSG